MFDLEDSYYKKHCQFSFLCFYYRVKLSFKKSYYLVDKIYWPHTREHIKELENFPTLFRYEHGLEWKQ